MRACVNQIFSLRTCFYYLNCCDLEKKSFEYVRRPNSQNFLLHTTQIVCNQDYGKLDLMIVLLSIKWWLWEVSSIKIPTFLGLIYSLQGQNEYVVTFKMYHV